MLLFHFYCCCKLYEIDAQAEAHKISAHQYDIQSMCEFTSGYILLFAGKDKTFQIIIE